MRREVLGEDKDVIQVEEAEGKITQNLIHKVLELVTSIPEAKRNSNIPKGVMIAVLWMSSGETGT